MTYSTQYKHTDDQSGRCRKIGQCQSIAIPIGIVGVQMGTKCAPLVADLFLFICYERDFLTSLSDENQSDIIKAFNSS